MNIRVSIYLPILLLVAAVLLTGCGKQKTEAPPAPASPSAPADLGTQQSAGPFQVKLDSDPEPPRVGKAHFMAVVTKDGQPVKGATVRLALSMSSMSGPEVTLEPMADGYGASADLSMSGDWTAKVEVSAGGASGTADYRFSAAQ